MSNYKNLTIDFPTRILEIISDYEERSILIGREVTFFLALASSAITIPLERLHPNHPSHTFEDLPELRGLRSSLEETTFLESIIWPPADPASWYYGGPLSSVNGNPEDWNELNDPKHLDFTVNTMTFLRHIRNSLSHGNIYTRGDPIITQFVFLAKKNYYDSKYMYLLSSPEDFKIFLFKWLQLLEPIALPSIANSDLKWIEW
jgi:hypothetical protein